MLKKIFQRAFLFLCVLFISHNVFATDPNAFGDDVLIAQLYILNNWDNGQPPHDSFGILFHPDYDNALNHQDARKPMNFYENLGINHNGVIYSLEKREMPLPGERFQLFTNNYSTQNYVIRFLKAGLQNVIVYLDDAHTGNSTLLNEDEVNFSFTVNPTVPASVASNRFSIRIEAYPDNVAPDYVYKNQQWIPTHPEGVSTTSDNILIMNGISEFNEPVTAHNIHILPGAALNNASAIYLHGHLQVEGALTFKSNENFDGEVKLESPTAEITGEVSVEQHFQDRRAYRMVSSSVTSSNTIHHDWQENATTHTDNPRPGFGTHITGSLEDQHLGFDGTATGNPSMYEVDLAQQTFIPIPNTDHKRLIAGDPYLLFVRGDRSIDLTDNEAASSTTLRAKGLLTTGEVSRQLNTNEAGDFAMFGNPYQSAIDVNAVFGQATNVNPDYYFLYDPSLGARGAYVTVQLPIGDNTSNSLANQFLQPGQAAQLSTLEEGPVSLLFKESFKTPESRAMTSAHSSNYENQSLLSVQLYTTESFLNHGAVYDSFGILFHSEYDSAINSADAKKPLNFDENLAIDKEGVLLSFEKRDFPQRNEIVALHTSGYTTEAYTFKIRLEHLEDYDFILFDHYLNTGTALDTEETVYSFQLDSNPESAATNRFSLFMNNLLEIRENKNHSVRLFPNPITSSEFTIESTEPLVEITVYDLLGRKVALETTENPNNMTKVNLSADLVAGTYVVLVKTSKQQQIMRLIIK